jgi:hypothetical protein
MEGPDAEVMRLEAVLHSVESGENATTTGKKHF